MEGYSKHCYLAQISCAKRGKGVVSKSSFAGIEQKEKDESGKSEQTNPHTYGED